MAAGTDCRPFDPVRDRALVTGAGNCIGRAIALGLVGEGVRTLFADVSLSLTNWFEAPVLDE
jgi:NAD(P)-dependent dehydrogenase (short-subunit alcohol dehydrogenase family)